MTTTVPTPTTGPPPLTILQPGQGDTGFLGTIGVQFKLWGSQTNGAVGAGGYITKPRGEMHAMWNAGDVPARMIEIISPSGFENFFRELSELLTADAPAMEELMELGERYGVQFGQPDWLGGVIDRYHLTPPPM
jgi:hypothetical protein